MDGHAFGTAPPANPPEPPRAGHDKTAIVSFALTLALISLATKVILLPFQVSNAGQFARWLLRLLVVASPDLSFVAGLTLACIAASTLFGRRPRVRAAWHVVVFGLYCLAGLYSVASVPMYRALLAPFSIRLIMFAGGPGMMASSVLKHVPAGTMAALAAVPLAFLVAPRLLARWQWFRAAALLPPGRAAATFTLVALYGTVCHFYVESHWRDPKRWERRLAQSPHAVLLASCVEELLKDQLFTQSFSFAEIDESDFRRARPDSAAARPQGNAAIAPDQRPTNVLLVVLESTAAEYLSLYGAAYPTTPELVKLAARNGVVYENMYAQAPASWKSLVGLVASVYCRPDWRLIVQDCPDFSVPTIPEVLRRHGFRNCFLHAGYWDWRGGEEFLKRRGVETLLDARHLPSPPLNSWGTSDRVMFQAALDWIDAHRAGPFFVCACTIETHHPYAPAADPHDFGVKDEDFNRYLNAIRTTDANLLWLMSELERRGLEESTLVAITADHGENFGQHDQRAHGFGVYEPSIHVPLVMLHRSLAGLPRRDRAVRQQIDIPPTLLDLLGIAAPPEWQGRSMLAPQSERRAYFYAMANQVMLGLRDGPYKYHYYVDTDQEELFDLARDPAELRNLAELKPDLTTQYKRRVGGFVAFQREFLERHGGQRVLVR